MTFQLALAVTACLAVLTAVIALLISARRDDASGVDGPMSRIPQTTTAFEAGAMRSRIGVPIPHFYAGSAGPIVDRVPPRSVRLPAESTPAVYVAENVEHVNTTERELAVR